MIFLIQSPHAWRGVWQRPHHLAARFARAGHSVRWVEPRYLKWLIGEPARFRRAAREMPEPRIEIEPVTLWNGERFGPIRAANMRRLAGALNSGIGADFGAGFGPRVLWLYHPHEGHLARSVPHDLLVYDIMDEFRGFPWSPAGIEREEAELLAAADWVFAGTRALFEAKRAKAEGKIECELSGVDAAHFARGERTLPADLAPIRARHAKLLGYAGMIDLRIDCELLAAAARRRPEWGWVFLGPIAAETGPLRALPNVYFLGAKTYEELPAYYQAWDAALVPFVENELTRHVNPTKILEYAAAELPVVCRALPDARAYYAEGAFLYDSPEEFQRALALALEEPGRAERAARLAAARGWAEGRGWDAIAARMLRRVEALLAAIQESKGRTA